jgi:hypothetical protein
MWLSRAEHPYLFVGRQRHQVAIEVHLESFSFVYNYHMLASVIGRVTYEPLERTFLPDILNSKVF